jgi:hypothetical protein
MTTYLDPFSGLTINPTQVGYESLTLSSTTFLQWPINGNTSSVVANIIDVTATTTGLLLCLPNATQVSTGQSVLIRNIGSNSFTVADVLSNTIITITSGLAWYIYLTDNTTSQGTWAEVQFGAGVSTANASALAGYGLTAINTTLNQAYSVSTLYSSTTLSASSRAQMFVWSTGAGTITLPSSGTAGNNWFAIIKNNGTGIVTITPQGSDTIDGNATQQLQLTESLVVVCNGSGFNTFAYGRSNAFAYTQLAITVTGGTYVLSSAQAANTIQTYSGALGSNQIIQVPSTVQLYAITNNTTNAYTLTVKTSGSGGTLSISQNQTVIAICDGTNVYNANSGAAGTFTSVTLAAGTVTTPTLTFTGNTTTGLYLPASNQIGVTVSGAQAALFSSSGLYVANGISGGNF